MLYQLQKSVQVVEANFKALTQHFLSGTEKNSYNTHLREEPLTLNIPYKV